MSKPIDNDARKHAVSEQDKNIVVTAGAGTGKTTLLVNRLLHVLLGHKRYHTEESPIRRTVAMTFTEKAASEMKIRLMRELETIVAVINGSASEEETKKVEGFLSEIRDVYQTTYREIECRARKSLEDMDKALIGTIHSFAAYILRLYPIESGVVPGFRVDEGDVFDELFDKEWAKWLETELALNSPHADTWKSLLKRTGIESFKELAKRLSGFTIPLDSLMTEMGNKPLIDHLHSDPPSPRGRESGNRARHARPFPGGRELREGGEALPLSPVIQSLIDPLFNKINDVIPSCEKPGNNLLSQLQELSGILESVKKQGIGYLNTITYDIDKDISKAKTGWTDEGFSAAQELGKECHVLLKKLKTVDDAFITSTISIILPFAKEFRQTYVSQGYVSFDGLLTLARDLLHNNEYRYIREKLKKEFRSILVDEFQDTDPVQYEIILFLSEALGHYSKDARKVTLEPGKLFIVGDPKQSIYAFRRADIEAYEHVVRQVCGRDETLKLQENFRSHSGIIEVVNQLFDGRIMVEQPGLQPRYIPIHANRLRSHSSQKVEMVLVADKDGKELKADEARESEAEWIARWIARQVNSEDIEDKFAENRLRKLKYRDVALLLRAFTQVRPYVEALKRYGIPYIVEGEKYFYTTQEILDFINLLRIIENPHDTIALVGVLRSPIAGLTDREIYELKVQHLLGYDKSISGETSFIQGEVGYLSPDVKKIIEPFYDFLRGIHVRAGTIPVSQLITEIIESTHVAEIAACAWHGEQKLANIWKLCQMACDMEQSEGISLKTFIERIRTRIKEAKEEGESPLSDETLDVVKILSIHKSKGLEFPVVILGNLHGEIRNNKEALDSAVFDWSASTTGMVIGRGDQRVRNLQSIVIEKKLNERSWEEEKRVLYVAMTRAKERLILTGALKDDDKSYMGLITQSVRDAVGIELGDEALLSENSHTKENNDLSPSSSPSRPGRGNRGNIPLKVENKTGKENEPIADKFPLPLRESVRVRGVSQGKFSLGNAEVFVEHFRFDGTHRPAKPPKEKKLDADWASFIETWKKRKEVFTIATQTSLFTSPSAISGKEAVQGEPQAVLQEVEGTTEVRLSYAAIVGTVCHRVLEGWDFQGIKDGLEESIDSVIKWTLANEKFIDTLQIHDIALIKAEALKTLSSFIDSDAYKELQDAQILGREVPILLNWNGQIMRGIIDILYKIDDRIIIADYKTDYVTMADLPVRAERYRYQKEVYIEAVKRCLKIDNPEFKLIFLRLGKAVAV
ncbi:MAG: UvrD-helicase domain-containing protein [Candidatus Brocadia sp.]|nr:UvrD-helicase domain-containing protein [Candidatus Brocadia sp.]